MANMELTIAGHMDPKPPDFSKMFDHPFFCLPEGDLSNKFNGVLFVTPENTISIDKDCASTIPTGLFNTVDHLITGERGRVLSADHPQQEYAAFINGNREGTTMHLDQYDIS